MEVSIGVAAKALGVRPETLRRWKKQGKSPRPDRPPRGWGSGAEALWQGVNPSRFQGARIDGKCPTYQANMASVMVSSAEAAESMRWPAHAPASEIPGATGATATTAG